MNQGGKQAAEPGRTENKRERRRGASGRAAALRRAPSDSDCSGETASLSADSAERAPRPAPLAPPRSSKTRSRRRGSEWEVLEGLKDGQRFEKRPDVFNGYLHKKRKWPLKGWHKRFFVVDGGILVYARSPTDVARGRLHGSVDVGLSVISAKARRRRIDIDADEFIYHLRAKTPEVFRTWLNVLKAHRLYRQHLLTFGARESVPKIHPPLEDLPPVESSSNSSFTTESSNETSLEIPNSDPTGFLHLETPCNIESSVYSHKDRGAILSWQKDRLSKSQFALDLPSLEQKMFDLKLDDGQYNRSMCSMKCATRYLDVLKAKNSLVASMNSTDAENQMTYTDFELNSPKNLTCEYDRAMHPYKPHVSTRLSNSKVSQKNISFNRNELFGQKRSPFLLPNKQHKTTACFFFARKKSIKDNNDSIMKKSKKCTNLVKYKNLGSEPPLKKQSSKCMLLGKYKLTATKDVDTEKVKGKTVACNADTVRITNNEVQVMSVKNKSSQKATTTVDCDKITEKLMISILQRDDNREEDVKFYIDKVVQDLYDDKVNLNNMHPLKALFRNLLEYWLKNTSTNRFKKAMTVDKSVDRQSNKHLTKDKNLSGIFMNKTKETQFYGLSDVFVQSSRINNISKPKAVDLKKTPNCQNPKHEAGLDSERHIQELEKLLRNTVYVCEMGRNDTNREKDINITKKLIDNLGKYRNNNDVVTDEKPGVEKSNSSAELPKIQDTINRLISETSIPPDVAKELLGAYLDVLMQDSSKSTTVSQSSDWDKQSQDISVECEVASEAVVKKVSKSVTTLNIDSQKEDAPIQNVITDTERHIDPGQIYLKDILEKVTTIFSKVKKIEDNSNVSQRNSPKNLKRKVQKTIKDELGRPVFKSKNDLIYENYDQNSLVIDLSKYKLEQISMFNDPTIKDLMSITIKLKEKPRNHGESKETRLSLKFPEETKPIVSNVDKCSNWLPFLNRRDATPNRIFQKLPLDGNKVTCFDFETSDKIDNLTCLSNSDRTSKARRPIDDSYNSMDEHTITNFTKDSNDKRESDDQPCYVMSIKKGALGSKFQSKKYSVKQQGGENSIVKSREQSPTKSPPNNESLEHSVFEKRAPKIIDEKFILLLLENLTYLSRTVPNLHKDINTLYLKLKKKHEKLVKNSNIIQGLSLLGKIYSEDNNGKDGDDKGTQYDRNVYQDTFTNRESRNACTNTNLTKIETEKKCAATYTYLNTDKAAIQTEPINETDLKTVSYYKSPNVERNSSTYARKTAMESETATITMKDESTSCPYWSRSVKDVAVNTVIKYALNNNNLRHSRPYVVMQRPYRLERECSRQKKTSPKVRQELIKEISLLTPFLKVSAQSQTEKYMLKTADKRELDYHVYQLFMSENCGVKASSSMTVTSNVKVMSDDMKTLYRCSSVPSYCSGLISPTIRGPQAGFVSGTPGGRLAGWIIESGGPLESATRELGQAQLSVQQLQRLLDALELQQQVHHDTDVSLEGASPNVKKDRRKFGLRKKKSNSKCASVELAPPHIDLSNSHTALSSLSALTAPPSPGGGASSMPNSAASLPIGNPENKTRISCP